MLPARAVFVPVPRRVGLAALQKQNFDLDHGFAFGFKLAPARIEARAGAVWYGHGARTEASKVPISPPKRTQHNYQPAGTPQL